MRVYAPGLNDTEFGFYFINYHSRLPTLSGVTGTANGFASAAGAATTFANLQGGNTVPGSIAAGTTAALNTSAALGGTLGVAEATGAAVGAANALTAVLAGDPRTGLPSAYLINEYAQTAQYKVEYPEDIKVYGVSFNTALDSIGASLQGEYSYHQDAPLQVDDVELLLAALSPLGDINPLFPFSDNQLTNGENLGLDTYVRGYEEKDVSQLQMTMTKLFGPTFGADQFVMVGEAGVTHVHGMPSKSDMRFESAGTYVTGNSNQADPGGGQAG